MITLAIWAGPHRVGAVTHDTVTGLYDFKYDDAWAELREAYPLSPLLTMPGLQPGLEKAFEDLSAEQRSTIVRAFFQNLMPEGQALDIAARSNNVSKSNLAGLLLALGAETAGALRVTLPGVLQGTGAPGVGEPDEIRPLPLSELSQRINDRASVPFAVWDGKVRLSIAGLQDKIAVYEHTGRLALVRGDRLASTAILKPAPTDFAFIDLPQIEHVCMRLAAAAGIETAATRLMFVPEPVLLVERFDRRRVRDAQTGEEAIERLHIIDACQALGLGPEAKYERLYGESEHVRNIRDGVSLPLLFSLANKTASPLRTRTAMLDRVLFNILIGNSDAHGKNWSFFVEPGGLLRLAPAYDLVDVDQVAHENMSTSFAMGVGDAFSMPEITPYELASMAKACGINRRHLAGRIAHLVLAVPHMLQQLQPTLLKQEVSPEVLEKIGKEVQRRAADLMRRAVALGDVPEDLL